MVFGLGDMKLFITLILGVALWLPIIAGTQEVVVTERDRYDVSFHRICQEALSDPYMTIFDFTIGKNSLRDVQKKLGPAEVWRRREQAPISICYISVKENDGTVVVFHAWKIDSWITAMSIMSDKDHFKERNQCTKSLLVSKAISTEGGIKLGLSKLQLKTILGDSTKEQGKNMLYLYQTKRAMTNDEIKEMERIFPSRPSEIPPRDSQPYWDVVSSIEATFMDSELIALTISKTETN